MNEEYKQALAADRQAGIVGTGKTGNPDDLHFGVQVYHTHAAGFFDQFTCTVCQSLGAFMQSSFAHCLCQLFLLSKRHVDTCFATAAFDAHSRGNLRARIAVALWTRYAPNFKQVLSCLQDTSLKPFPLTGAGGRTLANVMVKCGWTEAGCTWIGVYSGNALPSCQVHVATGVNKHLTECAVQAAMGNPPVTESEAASSLAFLGSLYDGSFVVYHIGDFRPASSAHSQAQQDTLQSGPLSAIAPQQSASTGVQSSQSQSHSAFSSMFQSHSLASTMVCCVECVRVCACVRLLHARCVDSQLLVLLQSGSMSMSSHTHSHAQVGVGMVCLCVCCSSSLAACV